MFRTRTTVAVAAIAFTAIGISPVVVQKLTDQPTVAIPSPRATTPAPQSFIDHQIGLFSSAATPNEDEAGWNCVDNGNRVCGPDNEGGVMVAAWPCTVRVNPATGNADVYTPDER